MSDIVERIEDNLDADQDTLIALLSEAVDEIIRLREEVRGLRHEINNPTDRF